MFSVCQSRSLSLLCQRPNKPPNSSCNTCDRHAAHTEVLVSASDLTMMEMYLGKIPVYTITLIGRLLSDAFLRYIRKQVEQLLRNVAKKMPTFQSIRHIPDIGSATIIIMPRQGEILEATNHYGHSSWFSPFTPNRRTR